MSKEHSPCGFSLCQRRIRTDPPLEPSVRPRNRKENSADVPGRPVPAVMGVMSEGTVEAHDRAVLCLARAPAKKGFAP